MYVNKRIYFEKDTGIVVMVTGGFRDDWLHTIPTVQEDMSKYSALAERVPETLSMLELKEGTYDDEFSKATSFKVDVKTNTLVFDFTPEEKKEVEQKKTLEHRISMVEATLNDMLLGGM
ncbi:hypothetical protein [Bacillus wiedmannii]|uniref:Uncharacterized protein n=1 Tax=Bacillus wiedmannii TaxID=1890302 RepID=A0A2A8BPK4_9BACI|nr:hypothetical protein [Bacillus wiedmannii]PEM55826.1 hypothetical protein CN611_13215 [Bacillus wiedmannii]HDR7785265.1 hypothetical protein [Bacillus wiedmannii]